MAADKQTTGRNQVGLRMDRPIPGSADNGGPGVMPRGKPTCSCEITSPHYHTRDGHTVYGRWGWETEHV